VVAFDAPTWKPPTAVVLDTNVVAEALLPREPEHVLCDGLFQRLAEARTFVVFNRLLEIELWEVIFNHRLRSEVPRARRRHARFEIGVRAKATPALDRAQRAWSTLLSTLAWRCVELEEVADTVPDLMGSYGLQSYDAVHAATLLASGVTDIVTRDAGFGVLLPEDATVHTTSARLSRTRARRTSAG
jgi:predicted nucleic acid-binding protein